MNLLAFQAEKPFLLVVSEERDYRLEATRFLQREFPDHVHYIESSPIEAIARRNSLNGPIIGIYDYDLSDMNGVILGKHIDLSSRYPTKGFVMTEGVDEDVEIMACEADLHYFSKKPRKGGEAFNLGQLLAAEIRKAMRALRKQIPLDGLTGLYTRDFAMELFKHDFAMARRSRKPLAAIVADINNFKFINDTFGHHIGDDALRKLGKAFNHLRSHYDIIARMGDKGDEIVVFMPDTAYAGAKKVIERLHIHIKEETTLEVAPNVFLPLTVAMGSSFLLPTHMGSDPMDGAAKLLKSADQRMYKDKVKKKEENLRFLKRIARECKKLTR